MRNSSCTYFCARVCVCVCSPSVSPSRSFVSPTLFVFGDEELTPVECYTERFNYTYKVRVGRHLPQKTVIRAKRHELSPRKKSKNKGHHTKKFALIAGALQLNPINRRSKYSPLLVLVLQCQSQIHCAARTENLDKVVGRR